MHCYHCGWQDGRHRSACPDNPAHIAAGTDADELIPVGTYWAKFIDNGRMRRDLAAIHGRR